MTQFNVTDLFCTKNVLDKGSVALFDAMLMDPRLKIVNSARVSYNKQSSELSEADNALISFLYEHGHFSTFRHSYFSFRIKAPLFVFRQWWKYQIGSNWNHDDLSVEVNIPDTSWNEMSGRYAKFDNEFYVPNVFRKQSIVNKQCSEGIINNDLLMDDFKKNCNDSLILYHKLINEGVAREIARMILPQNIYSECVWTCSLQTIIHFLHQRLKNDAQYEIKEYAIAIRKLLDPVLHVMASE